MSEPLFSPQWHRVASLTPRLRAHVRVHRHVYRGQSWYVLQDPLASRVHRFTPGANAVIGLMDGVRTVQQIFEAAVENLGDDAPTQGAVVDLLARLHRADLLQAQVRPDAHEVDTRRRRERRSHLAQRFRNPLALRIALLRPDAALERCRLVSRVLFSWPAALAWSVLVVLAAAVAVSHAPALLAHVGERALSAHSLAVMLVAWPVIKLLHELGHALAVKRWGGEVREAGLLFLVLLPMPYVDASGAAAFAEKHRRIMVSAAGIATELGVAAMAVLIWAHASPGVLRDVALDVMLIGSVSTLVFNANPLLRFDGYYILADLIEIPNLGNRAQRYLGYLLLRHVFRVDDARSPVTAPGEAPWLLFYGLAASAYRVFVAVAIIMFVAGKFFVVGVVLAAVATLQMLVLPALRRLGFLLRDPSLARRRVWAVAVSGAALGMAAFCLFFLPVPFATMTQAVVWLPEDARVRAGASGFVAHTHVAPGERVREGQALFVLSDPLREVRIQVLEAKLRELEVELLVEAFGDRIKAAIFEERIDAARAELEREREQAGNLVVRSPGAGVVVLPAGAEPTGRHVEQGDELALVVRRADLRLRAVVDQDDVTLLRERLRSVQLRFADRPEPVHAARLVREVPAGRFALPSPVLGTQGGGRVPVLAEDERGLKVSRRIFQVELALEDATQTLDPGQRVHVRLDHGAEPLAWQWRRLLERAFLGVLGS